GGLGWGHGATSVLTEPSAFPSTTLGDFHDASSVVESPTTAQQSGRWGEVAELRRGDAEDLNGGGSVDTASGLPLTPHPPPISYRATCGSSSGMAPSTIRKSRRLAKIQAVKPGALVFNGGIRIGDDYALLSVVRSTEGFGVDGTQGFRLKAYFPLSLSIYTLGASAACLPAFMSGSRTAVRHLFQPGEKSRRRWEAVAACLALRPSSDIRKPVGKGQPIEVDSPLETEPTTEAGTTATTGVVPAA
ncbi:unnamed protein product, partial [Pylaiella littoralis]